jgi:hypothetical protein
MKNWEKIALTSVGLIGSGVGLALWYGRANWNEETERLIEKLKEQTSCIKPEKVSFNDFGKLPAPVAKYFRLVLKDGQPIIKTARFTQTGNFLLNEKWIQFEATQYFSANPHAFVWDADMLMNPLLNVRVRDAFVDGEGLMKAKILSLIPVMGIRGSEKLVSGALQRYLAESVWFPTSLLPSKNLVWGEINENRALATLTESGTTVSLEFRFNEAGEITEVFSPARFREVRGEFIPTPWLGRFWNYEERNGFLIPTEGEVEWQIATGNMPYWKGKITESEYEFIE